jgi:hypothetical protein
MMRDAKVVIIRLQNWHADKTDAAQRGYPNLKSVIIRVCISASSAFHSLIFLKSGSRGWHADKTDAEQRGSHTFKSVIIRVPYIKQ